jgi:hypothetical protein
MSNARSCRLGVPFRISVGAMPPTFTRDRPVTPAATVATCTAFSPTGALVRAHRASVPIMFQSTTSLVVAAVRAARAINTL